MEIQNISPEQMDVLFGETTESVEQTPPQPEQTIDTNEPLVINSNQNVTGIQNIDFDELLEDDEDEQEVLPKEGDTSETELEKKPKVENKTKVEDVSINTVLKNTTKFMIEKGLWKDFEGSEELDIDQETYAELASKQFEEKVQEAVSEAFDSTGEYGKAIISHIKDGGNPDEIIDIFKEQKQIQQIDTSSDEGKAQIVARYYSDVLGWKTDRVKKHLQRIIADEDLDIESSEIEEKYNEYYSQQLEQIETERENRKASQIENQKKFQNSINNVLTELDYNEADKRKISNALLAVKKLPNGQVTTEFNAKFAEVQNDPKKLVRLVDYILDEENFVEKLSKKISSKTAVKQFNFIKGNSTTSKTKGSTFQETDTQNTLDFSQILKTKK